MNFLPEAYNQSMEIMKVIAANIERERGEESRASLAKRAGVTYQTVYDVEEGNKKLSIDVLEKIAGALRVDPADLLKRKVPLQKPLKISEALKKMLSIPDDVYDLAEKLHVDDDVWEGVEGLLQGAINARNAASKKNNRS
jgi:transcriptional regulator with XRE-family HTH domain